MKVIDISRELFSTPVYPGDPEPRRELVRRMELGIHTISRVLYRVPFCHPRGCPRHFINDGKTVDELDLSGLWGAAQVGVSTRDCHGGRHRPYHALLRKDPIVQGRRGGLPLHKRCICLSCRRRDVGWDGCLEHRPRRMRRRGRMLNSWVQIFPFWRGCACPM